MVKYENQCVDCGKPCIREACRYFEVPVYICDICGRETDEPLAAFYWEDICPQCAKEKGLVIDD